MNEDFNHTCPIPFSDYPQVLLAHGGGCRLMADLIAKIFLPAFANPLLAAQHDGALIDWPHRGRLAFPPTLMSYNRYFSPAATSES